MLGRRLEDLFPVAFLPEHHALAIAIMSYNGGLDYGLLGDYDALPDIDVIAEGIDRALGELLTAAGPSAAGPSAEARRQRPRAKQPNGAARRRAGIEWRLRARALAGAPVARAAREPRTGGRHARQARPRLAAHSAIAERSRFPRHDRR